MRERVAAALVLAAAIEPLLGAHASVRKSFTELHRQVLAVTRIDPVSRRLMTVPERCARSKAVGARTSDWCRAHTSRAPPTATAGSPRPVTRWSVPLYEAAKVLLARVIRWSPLQTRAVRLARRSGGKRAQVALARRLAVTLPRIWLDGTTFTWTRERATAAV